MDSPVVQPPGAAAVDPDADGMPELLISLGRYAARKEVALVRRAYDTAREAHRDQRRASGEPYITHPVAVAQILVDLHLDATAIAAALLHDVVEDTAFGQADVEAAFGPEVARLVDGVTTITALAARENAPSEAENLRRMLLAAVDDLRVILIKLADRLHNMRTLQALSAERRRRMAQETLEISAPIANRLGLWQIKSELEDLALRVLDPEAHATIEHELADRRHRHKQYLAEVIRQLEHEFAEAGIAADISSRTKHVYSIYRKMQRKSVTAQQVYDVLAVRIILQQPAQCYQALGVVHTLWAPIAGQFDDYIAKRKNNLYQSLHTTVLGPANRPIEIQIRTREMHEVAEYGVAAHWKYKEGAGAQDDPAIEEKIATLRRRVRHQDEDAADAEAFVEGLKSDVFQDQVYVFTPKGKVMELPAGSTPVDFAYHVHSEVGHRCRGAIVDDRMVALDTTLRTGQTVRIITAKGDAGPSRDWLNPDLGYAMSTRAREHIRQWFRRQQRNESIREGRDVLDRQLRKLGLTKVRHDEVARLFDHERLDDFLATVGRHDIPPDTLAARLLETYAPPVSGSPATARPGQGDTAAARPGPGVVEDVVVRGVDGLQTHAAACCRPLPGEDVLGYVTRGRGVTLHRATCPNIARLLDREPERFIRVHWSHSDAQTYPVELQVHTLDRPGLVRDISDVIARRNINVASLSAAVDPVAGTATVTVIVQIASYEHLAGLIDKLATLDNVVDVHRSEG